MSLDCSICLTTPTDPVQTNCGHKYCASCVLRYWHSDCYPRPCKCPLCRREINLLIPANGSIRDREMQRNVCAYNNRMSSHSVTLLSQVRDTPTLIQYVFRELVSIGGLSCCKRVWIIVFLFLVMIYLISPIDLIPEAIFGPIGLIDDIISIIAVFVYIAGIYRQDMIQRTR